MSKKVIFQAAADCSSWMEVQVAFSLHPDFLFSKREWMNERENLLNKPRSGDAPKWATHYSLSKYRTWYWHSSCPTPPSKASHSCFGWHGRRMQASLAVVIPAGIEWQEQWGRVADLP